MFCDSLLLLLQLYSLDQCAWFAVCTQVIFFVSFLFFSLNISLGLVTFLNYAVSDSLCHTLPGLVNCGWTHTTCFDIAFFSSVPYYKLPSNLTFTAVFALAFQQIWWNSPLLFNISLHQNYSRAYWLKHRLLGPAKKSLWFSRSGVELENVLFYNSQLLLMLL